uniref:Small ribosomal subunit protein uS9c n=1 Tax=Treubaria triappendiculata TaxID=1755147 RepID=A0A0S2LMW9_TRETR|nr:ribosomal protein S9 [Treubaria triappendiculata]ALO62675.1 ribosomal protein S9 [Treubaria triappendiculata]
MTQVQNILANAVGRRKEAVAQIHIFQGSGQFLINGKPAHIYLQNNLNYLSTVKAPFEILQNNENFLKANSFDTIVKVQGGGLNGQADAIKLGIARALYQFNHQFDNSIKKSLKVKGYLTQDSRAKERRKYGLKKARKASQYHKR